MNAPKIILTIFENGEQEQVEGEALEPMVYEQTLFNVVALPVTGETSPRQGYTLMIFAGLGCLTAVFMRLRRA